jgi:hypothetical protein
MNIVAIDPGPEVSGVVILSPERRIISAQILANTKIVADLRMGTPCPFPHVAIEMIASYGMPVGAEIFETCVWIGRFAEAYVHSDLTAFYFRKDIKLHLCGTTQAKDANVRQALIDLLGPPGVKKNPGPTYGISKHMWAALALAIYAHHVLNTSPPSPQ